jgi:transcriptional regulator with XRE-family HTH domain
MGAAKSSEGLDKDRLRIARKVRELRTERHLTQEHLARKLHVSQGRLSDLERGTGSFTAEQLLAILRLFNVAASDFVAGARTHDTELQNALARLGAVHLQESAEVVPSEQLEEVANVVRESLLADSPRYLTALAPVLVRNIERLNLRKLVQQLAEVGLDRRLAWIVNNTVEALRQELPSTPRGQLRQTYRRAELLLGEFLAFLVDRPAPASEGPLDLLDRDIVTKRTLDEVAASSSAISRRWGIATSIQLQDFVDALRAARGPH